MNWLAHLFLAEPSPEFRLGSVLPDLARQQPRRDLPPDLRRGIECHLQVDRFTDTHGIVRRSIRRLNPRYRRFAGILVDVFYDHFLARDWVSYAEVSLDEFARDVYRSLEDASGLVSPEVRFYLARMRENDLLCSYRTVEGIELALDRLGRRFRRAIDLAPAIGELQAHYAELREDFAAFFPELRECVDHFSLQSGPQIFFR